MIKSVTVVKPVVGKKDHHVLSDIFDSLGFESGQGWKDAESVGASFLAPLGNLEIYTGNAESAQVSDLLVEVAHLTDVHALVTKKITKSKIKATVTDIKPTTWGSSIFRLQVGGLRIGIWAFDKPKKQRFQTIEGDLHVKGARFGIVVSGFNAFITERLLIGALDALHRTGTKDKNITVVRVPGAFEVPLAARKLAQTKTVDAVICLGLLMRGETSNYEHISDEVARGIGQASQQTGVPCTYGVLTCDTLEQAIDRAGLKTGNKGFEAAISAVEMVALVRKIKSGKKNNKVLLR